mmetsp:Transcript_21793/g.45998  ORF Transcript_21793/g.45998 Transcript_21793/m.45998 type:complete len:109 (-) Transcript_21793:37-363(-)
MPVTFCAVSLRRKSLVGLCLSNVIIFLIGRPRQLFELGNMLCERRDALRRKFPCSKETVKHVRKTGDTSTISIGKPHRTELWCFCEYSTELMLQFRRRNETKADTIFQ